MREIAHVEGDNRPTTRGDGARGDGARGDDAMGDGDGVR